MLNFLAQLLSPYYYPLLIGTASYFFILSLANHYEMWRFTHGPEIFDGPLVSVLIPARNEEKNIERCLNSLRNQLYKNFEILVINDNSTDGTERILEHIAAEDDRVKVFNGKPLPDDWYGKPFALHQLSANAKGEILLLTDADTVHSPSSISWAVTNLQFLKADMISGYIGQVFMSFGEVITVPLMFFLTGFVIPLFINRSTKKVSVFSAAIGQYIAIRRDVFNAIGGCETFKKKTSEDVYMSRYVKRMGYSTRFLNICEHVKCRMYNGYHGAIEGIGKNIFDFLGKNTLIIFLIGIAVTFFLFFPFPLLIGAIINRSPWLLHILFVNILYTLTWLFMFLGQRLNGWYCLLWPLMFLNLLYMAAWSWFRTITGKGFTWKDRKVS
ncbi:MAG: glycosyltransferase family 2 protein [Treponema sp.]|jgi:chlorobactene glucosyltransferase|nr:glycosyltransferase family 2 protein [Treponema sp.]